MKIEHKTLHLFSKLLFEKAILKTPFTRPVSMPNEACFLYLLDGEYNSVAETSQLRIAPREGLLMKCGNYLGQFFGNRTEDRYEAVAVHLYPEILKRVYAREMPDFLRQKPHLYSGPVMTRVKANQLLKSYVESILFYLDNPQLATESILTLKVRELLLILSQTEEAKAVKQILSDLFSPNTYSFREIVEAHALTGISVNELAQLTNLSLSTFKREFKKNYNESPGQFLRTRKLKKAKELLELSNLGITQIAFDCGFSDVAHFSHAFKEKFGLPPTQYRNQRTPG